MLLVLCDIIKHYFVDYIGTFYSPSEKRNKYEPVHEISNLSRDSVPQSSETSRFLPSTSSEISNFISVHENKNTKIKTSQDLNLMHSYLVSQGEHRQIHEIPPDQLCDYLSAFLFAVRKKDGGEYEPTSLRGFLGSFERHLKNKNYGFSIINDDKFHRCRAVLKAKTKDLKSQGKGNTPHAAEAISDQEVDQLYDAKQLGADNAASLQNTLWYIFCFSVWYETRR